MAVCSGALRSARTGLVTGPSDTLLAAAALDTSTDSANLSRRVALQHYAERLDVARKY